MPGSASAPMVTQARRRTPSAWHRIWERGQPGTDMKVPEPLFVIINPIVKALLHSPAHGLLSDSVMIVGFRGRKSGREFSTPVRYLRDGNLIRAFSHDETQWWRNLRDNATVTLRAGGETLNWRSNVIEKDPATIRRHLEDYFQRYPEDAVYHDVTIDRDGVPNAAELDAAAERAIVVEARPLNSMH